MSTGGEEMDIQGFQKLTLLDYPERVACTVFLAGCNFRCPFCHNASLVTHVDTSRNIPEERIFSFLEKRAGILDGVCITGGEPLLALDLEEFIKRIRSMGYLVKLDTNGSNVNRLEYFLRKGLVDYVAMDVKNSPAKYGMTAGIEDYSTQNVRESVKLLMKGRVPYEFRTTVVREFHKREDFEAIGEWLRGAEKYYLQSFADSGDLIRPGLHGYTREIMEQALAIVRKYVPNAQLRGT